MRPSQKGRGSRNKSGRNKPVGNVINRVFESAGPEGKVRGTPQQIIEKYQALARDAQTAGERVLSENFLQHAEHYVRLLNAAYEQAEERRQQQAHQQGGHQGETDGGQGERDGEFASSSNGHAGARDEQTRRPEPRADAPGREALETIDASDDEGGHGPVETPENAAAAPEDSAAPADSGAAPEPEKKPEPRRRRRKAPQPEAAETAEASPTEAGGA
jgi:hypothetical protein